MNREAMPRKKDMEAVKAESPTLVPSMEDAETVLSTEAETVMKDDSETVKAEGFEAAGQDGDTVNSREVPGMDASVVGTPENPINLDTGEVYDEEDEVTEKIDMKAREMREVDHEADTVQLEQAAEEAVMEAGEDTVSREPSILASADAFNAMMSAAKDLNFPLNEVDSVVITDVTYKQFSGWEKQLAEKKSNPDSGYKAGILRWLGMGSETKVMNDLQDQINAILQLEFQVKAKQGEPKSGESRRSFGRSAIARSKGRKRSAGGAGFGKTDR